MGASARPKKKDVLQQRIPSNPKYAHVKSTLDTGASVSKFEEKAKNVSKPKVDEYFKRIKGSHLVELIEDEDVEEESVFALVGAEEVKGSAECVVHSEASQEMDEALYLLLDLRDEADFEECHINTATHYPHTQLTHSTNYFSAEIYRYKNRPDRMIILYDDDERISGAAGKLFVEKGVENVYVLTGGLRKFSEKFEEHVIGTIPEFVGSCPPTAKSGRSGGSSRCPPTGSTRPPQTGKSSGSMMSVAKSVRSHGAPSISMR